MAETAPHHAAHAEEPKPFGPYLLLRRLGRGGMAEAYLAERTGPGEFRRRLCLKLILADSAEDKEFIGWFFDEAKIHAQLHHEHIVQVYEFGEYDGRNYLALEYVDGCDLRSLMHALEDHGLRLPVHLAIAIAYELASALECAHQLKIGGVAQHLVHRDLTPSNVLLSTRGHAKLSDFGVVKATSRQTRTETGIAKGKVPYMSPEQISGGEIDARTDLFALGIILYELLTGQHPFRRKREDPDILIARRLVDGERPALRELASHAPDRLIDIVDRLLAPNVGERVRSASEVLDLLAPLAPGAAAARELGEFVSAARGERAFPDSVVRPAVAASDAAATGDRTVTHSAVLSKRDEGAKSAAASASREPSRAIIFGALGLVALLLVALGTFLVVRKSDDAVTAKPAPVPAAPAAVSANPPTEVAVKPASVQASAQQVPVTVPVAATPAAAAETNVPTHAATAPQAEAEDSKRAKAKLRVIVLPFGEVEVDGKKSRAPVTLELSAGRHSVHAGRTAALTHREVVRLKAGDNKELIIDLQPGE